MKLKQLSGSKIRKYLLVCGICSPLIYLLTDLTAGFIYQGYSFNEQAVSELFAIGAPTSPMVVPLFTISSLFLLAFGIGVWFVSNKIRILRFLALMIAANAIESLVLWNFFPMHMRGVQPTLTDLIHTILATNPLILISIILGAWLYKNWFRYYSVVTIVILVIPAIISFSYIPLLLSNQPTPWMGFTERIALYGQLIWHGILSSQLLREFV